VGQVLFRYFYYADLAPNTYVLKMTGVATGTRLAAGAIALVDTLPVIAPAIALAAVGAFATRVPALVRDCSRLALGTLVIQWVYLVWIGGDAWLINYSNRFIAAILPTLLVAAVAATPTCLDVLRQSKTATVRFVAGDVLLLAALGLRHPHAFVSGPQWLLLAGWLLLLAVATVQMMPLPAGRWSANAATVTALALFLASSAHGWLAWSLYRAPKAADDIAFARLGLMLRERLPDDAVIASAWVGAPAYFSQLRSLDLLGKTDAHVARVAPTGVFRPGHNKMDLAYSVGLLRPDVVLLDNPAIATYGYRRLPNGLWLRPGSSGRFDVDLRASWCTAASESVYCPNMQLAAR
jgi:hypothetical protein